MIDVSLPARINVVGSPTDAVEGAYATISAAVALRGGARIEAGGDLELGRRGGGTAVFGRGRIEDPRGFAVEAAAVNALLRHAPELGAGLSRRGARITTWTDVPASSGLAGSSVLVLAVLCALRAAYALDPRRYNDYVVAEIAQRAEEMEMGVTCGYADRYVPLFGDVAYITYRGKLAHAPLGEEPYATYEMLGARAPALRFCVATTGVRRDSGAVHAPMRRRYLEERRAGSGRMLALARQIGETAWRGKVALLGGDLEGLGRQITRNQELVDEMMQYCGFAHGAGAEVRSLVAAALGAGALGAKLTGAGGGGAVFALSRPGGEESIAAAMRDAAARLGLTGAQVLVLPVSRTGLEIETGTVQHQPEH